MTLFWSNSQLALSSLLLYMCIYIHTDIPHHTQWLPIVQYIHTHPLYPPTSTHPRFYVCMYDVCMFGKIIIYMLVVGIHIGYTDRRKWQIDGRQNRKRDDSSIMYVGKRRASYIPYLPTYLQGGWWYVGVMIYMYVGICMYKGRQYWQGERHRSFM